MKYIKFSYASDFQLTERRSRALEELKGITEEQRHDMETTLTGQPGKKDGSLIVSSDVTDIDEEGEKIFRKKKISKRSKMVLTILDRLDKIARNKAAKQGTSLFKRVPGTEKSKRDMPTPCPEWMLCGSSSNSDTDP